MLFNESKLPAFDDNKLQAEDLNFQFFLISLQ